jgi:DNA polymerase-3 subunit delta'
MVSSRSPVAEHAEAPVADVHSQLSAFVPGRSLIGLDAARKVLWGALERNELAGAYLLRGPAGSGKTTLARAFAQAAACTKPVTSPFAACEQCLSCRLAARGSHPEIVSIAPAGDQTQIWQFWDRPGRPAGALERTLPFSPTVGARRVYIIERADTLNNAAANSLLKVLEEPPEYAVFVLLTPNADRLLPTILSRCQAIAIPPMPLDALAHRLSGAFGLSAERALALATLAEGRIGTAHRFATDPSALTTLSDVFNIAMRLASAPPLRALRISEELRAIAAGSVAAGEVAEAPAAEPPESSGTAGPRGRADRRGIGVILDMLAFAFRDLLAVSLGTQHTGIVSPDDAAVSDALDRLGPEGCLMTLERILTARRRLDQNVPPNLLTDWLAISISAACAVRR